MLQAGGDEPPAGRPAGRGSEARSAEGPIALEVDYEDELVQAVPAVAAVDQTAGDEEILPGQAFGESFDQVGVGRPLAVSIADHGVPPGLDQAVPGATLARFGEQAVHRLCLQNRAVIVEPAAGQGEVPQFLLQVTIAGPSRRAQNPHDQIQIRHAFPHRCRVNSVFLLWHIRAASC